MEGMENGQALFAANEQQHQEQMHQEKHAEAEQEQQVQEPQHAVMQPQQQVQQQPELLIDRMQREEAEFWAQHAVPAGAVQNNEIPRNAGRSDKQRRKLAKQREKAVEKGGLYSGYPDEYTAQIHQAGADYQKNHEARLAAFYKAEEAHPQEPEVKDYLTVELACAYLPDYKRNKKNRPASRKDAQIARRAQQQAEDYLYGTQEAKNAVLDNIVNDMITLELNEEMFTVEYIRSHFSKMKRLDEKLMRMSLLTDKHESYFENLQEEKKRLWNATRSLANILSTWITNTAEMSGLNTANRPLTMKPLSKAGYKVMYQLQERDIADAFRNRDVAVQNYRNHLGNH